jgi:hypothetical protein
MPFVTWPNLLQQPQATFRAAESLGIDPLQIGERRNLSRGNLPCEECFFGIGQPPSELVIAIKVPGIQLIGSTSRRAARRPADIARGE